MSKGRGVPVGKVPFVVVLLVGVVVGGAFGFKLAGEQAVSQSTPAYDWLMAEVVRKSPAIDLAQARQGTDRACLFGPYTDSERIAKIAGLSLEQEWSLRRMAGADAHGVLLLNKGAVTDAFLVRSDIFAETDVAVIEGQCASSLVFHRQNRVPPRTVSAKGAVSGEKQRINWALSVNPDCTPDGMPTVIISTPPAHGRAFVEVGGHHPNFEKNNIRWRCNLREMPALLVYYQSEAGYVGEDRVGVDVVFPDGKVTLWDHPITVR